MPYFHHDVQKAEAKIKEQLPNVFIDRSDRGFGLAVYSPAGGETIIFRRASAHLPEVIADLDEVIAKYRPAPPPAPATETTS